MKTKRNLTLNPLLVELSENAYPALGMSSLSEFVEQALREYLEANGVAITLETSTPSVKENAARYLSRPATKKKGRK